MNVKILVADTSSTQRKNFKRSLKEIGVEEVVEAADADSALNLLKHEQFNAVLADGKIETESGKDLVEEIRHIDSNVPIIVTADQAERSTEWKAKHPSASGYLTTPFTTDSLSKKLQEFVPTIAG